VPKISHKRMQGGPGRPFLKGVSGNPAGRPPRPIGLRAMEADVRRLARERGSDAIEKLVALMRGAVVVDVGDPENPKRIIVPVGVQTQLSATVAILDRGYGRPGLAVELAGKAEAPIVHESESAYDIICRRMEAIRQRLIEDGHIIEP
jgi:hypothetical protein